MTSFELFQIGFFGSIAVPVIYALVFGIGISSGTIGLKVPIEKCLTVDATERLYDSAGNCYILTERDGK